MTKKRKSGIFTALIWIITGILHIFYVIAKFIFGVVVFVFSTARKSSHASKAKYSEPIYKPLIVQKALTGEITEFENKISSKSAIGLILGARGSGKSALGMRILENMAANKRKVCAMGFDESSLPGWIKSINNVDEIPNNYFILVDEGGILFSSRSSQSTGNKLLSSLLLVARHKDISVLFISQNSANLEINSIRQADYLLMRKPSLLQKEFERKKIGQLYDEVNFMELPDNGKHLTYIYSDEFRGFASNELPGFWNDNVSKSFARLELKK